MDRVTGTVLASSQQAQWDAIRDYLLAYAGRRPVRRVVVVGNAPMSPDPARAAEIDAGDLVIRTNGMMLDGPEDPPCLGTTCHAVILSRSANVTPWVLHNYRRRAYLIPQAGFVQWHRDDPVHMLLQAPFWPADLGAMPLPNAVVKVRTSNALDPAHKPGSIIPTTGTMALFLAHEMFPDAEVMATGFSFLDDPDQKRWFHHAGDSTKVNWQHRLDLEAKLVRSWISDGSVRFYG